MGIAGFALAITAIALALALEWVKRPHLEIRASPWNASGPLEVIRDDIAWARRAEREGGIS